MHMFLYKLCIAQELEDDEYIACNEFAKWCLQNIQLDALDLFPTSYFS